MLRLSDTNCGPVRCLAVDGEGEAAVQLKRMGICSGRILNVIQAGDPMVLSVMGTRLGLSRQLAASVTVEITTASGATIQPNPDVAT